ncbi:MAG: hypothetical protein LBE79_01930 [Tannerella sp.]|nr:hypothetical protein [Tannerella sp.]
MDSVKGIRRKFIAIIAGISALFFADMYYLARLYNDISEELDKVVVSCIKEADMKEVVHRMELISNRKKDNGEGGHTFSRTITRSFEEDDSEDADSVENESAFPLDILIINSVIGEMRVAIHRFVDSIMPVIPHVLDSFIVSNFQAKGITARLYYTERVDLATGKVMETSYLETKPERTNFYLHEYDPENRLAYRIYTESLTGSIVRRMSGILAATFLIIILLS